MIIKNVQLHPLRQIPDDRGKVMHMLRCDDPWFEKFGEIYFSVVYPGVWSGFKVTVSSRLSRRVVPPNLTTLRRSHGWIH